MTIECKLMQKSQLIYCNHINNYEAKIEEKERIICGAKIFELCRMEDID